MVSFSPLFFFLLSNIVSLTSMWVLIYSTTTITTNHANHAFLEKLENIIMKWLTGTMMHEENKNKEGNSKSY